VALTIGLVIFVGAKLADLFGLWPRGESEVATLADQVFAKNQELAAAMGAARTCDEVAATMNRRVAELYPLERRYIDAGASHDKMLALAQRIDERWRTSLPPIARDCDVSMGASLVELANTPLGQALAEAAIENTLDGMATK
jgi:hypothetical protein